MKRGEIWMVAGGVYASKPRPALIVQDDLFEATESVTVLPMTSTPTDAPFIRYWVSADEVSGLDRDSQVMIDKLTTIRRANVAKRVGRLTSQQMVDVERLMTAFLGLAG